MIDLYLPRSSRPEMFYKKAVHRNFAKFTGKYPSQSLFFNKVAILRSDLRSSQRRCSVREGIQEHLRWLLPNIYTGSTILLIWPSNIVRTRDPPSCSYDLQTLSGHRIHHPAHMTFKHRPATGSTILLIWPGNILNSFCLFYHIFMTQFKKMVFQITNPVFLSKTLDLDQKNQYFKSKLLKYQIFRKKYLAFQKKVWCLLF